MLNFLWGGGSIKVKYTHFTWIPLNAVSFTM